MADTTIEAAAADVLKSVAPRMKVTGESSKDGETVSIRGIRIQGEVPMYVDGDGDKKWEHPLESDELRGIAQAMRVVCENIHKVGERCLKFQANKQEDGSYTLECKADVPGRILDPLKELNINLSGQGVAAGKR